MSSINFRAPKSSLVALFVLAGITANIVNLALAITAFSPTAQPVGYVAQLDATNYDLTSGTENVFRPEYETEFWSGNLYAYPVDSAGNINATAELWGGGAAIAIDAQNFDSGRRIVTMRTDGTKIPFRAPSLSTTQQTSLNTTIGAATYTYSQVIDFIRGDRTNEGALSNQMRLRKYVLGDIIHSRPFYVPDSTYPTIFVGANDGMLHAINTNTSTPEAGSERWAYIPSMLIPKLKALTAQPYVHNYFVDGPINIANTTNSGRVLVGALGSGARGLFSLDVTNLGLASEADLSGIIKWEIDGTTGKVNYSSSTPYQNLGYVYSTPLITKIMDGTIIKDVVIVGNGYNNGGDYRAHLYVINIADGSLIRDITVADSGSSSAPNGLMSTTAIDTNNDGLIEKVYAADLNGSLWRFDLTSTAPGNWTSSLLFTTLPAQPITASLAVAEHPRGGYIICFGTGSIFKETDLTDISDHYVYGIWDSGSGSVTADQLQTQVLTEKLWGTEKVRVATENPINWASQKGWKVKLLDATASTSTGERILGEGAFIENGRFYFSAFNPSASYVVPNTTTTVTGENWLMELDYLTGGVNSNNRPFLDMNGDLLLNDTDRVPYTSSDLLPLGAKAGDPNLTTAGIPVGRWISYGVQSQPILVQLRNLNTTLFNQNPNIAFPPQTVERGVAGGHFDIDNFMSDACTSSSGGKATGTITFNFRDRINPSSITVKVGGTVIASGNPDSYSERDMASWLRNEINNDSNDYTASRDSSSVIITANTSGASFNGTLSIIIVSSQGLGEDVSGMTGGVDIIGGSELNTSCSYDTHTHQYDDIYDKTGLDMLNASNTKYNLARHLASVDTPFKVLLMNQYLSPAASLHIGRNDYDPASSIGYIPVKSYLTSSNLVIAELPTYTLSSIGSLAINLPVNAFDTKDWWGGSTPDMRVGLHPTKYSCVWSDSDSNGRADLYNSVIPPTNGVDGPGTLSSTEGARHNGALTVQIIKADTPQVAIEENVPGRPEYGWRVKSNYFSNVLAEYSIYWHHPNGMCYHDDASKSWATSTNWNTPELMNQSGWTKMPPIDTAPTSSSVNKEPARGSTDPKLGSLNASCALPSSNISVSGNTTVTTFTCVVSGVSTFIYKISRTINPDGSVTILTELADGTKTTETIANPEGSQKRGGDERGSQARTGRISWHELLRD